MLPEFNSLHLEEKKKFKLKNMDKGHYLRVELEAIEQLLNEKSPEFKKGYFK